MQCPAGVGIWIGFSQIRTSAHAIAALMLGSFSEAFSITVVDSVLVTRIHGQSLEIAASLQSICWGLQVRFFPEHLPQTRDALGRPGRSWAQRMQQHAR